MHILLLCAGCFSSQLWQARLRDESGPCCLRLAWCGHRVAQLERKCTSLSALDRRIGSLFFMWDIFNVFLGAMLVRSSLLLGLSPPSRKMA
jgi:hypothetical protein